MSEKDLPERVRDARRARGMTQEQFAEAAGVKARAYQNFETRVSRPQPENLRKILRAAGIDPDDRETDEDPIDGELSYFLDVVKLWLVNMDPERRSATIREWTRRIVSGRDFTEMRVVSSRVSHG